MARRLDIVIRLARPTLIPRRSDTCRSIMSRSRIAGRRRATSRLVVAAATTRMVSWAEPRSRLPMPAVVVEDITILPRIPEPDPIIARQRPVRGITNAPRGFEGEGFPVRRAFAGVDLADLDPFVHFDQMGEVEYAPGEPKGTPWHPHRGFETVTYMIDGTFEHSDSNGGGGVITNGDTQWMTAGAGILHIEKP